MALYTEGIKKLVLVLLKLLELTFQYTLTSHSMIELMLKQNPLL